MSDQKAIVKATGTDVTVPEITPESISAFQLAQELLIKSAKSRRTKKTHRAIRKPRVVGKNEDGSDRVVDTVDRPEFQKWWDDTFPGWNISVCNYSTLLTPDGKPFMFNCDLMVDVFDVGGIKRSIPGTGSASVSVKELDRSSAQLLTNKRTIAKTAAMKDAAGWLGAFFDLRVDEESRERSMMPPDERHQKQFNELIAEIPEGFRGKIETDWKLQNIDTAQKYLDGMEAAVNRRKDAKKTATPQPNNTTESVQP